MGMHVSLVTPYDPMPPESGDKTGVIGGVEQVYAQYARGLARRGHQVNLVCSTKSGAGTTQEDGITMIRVPRRGALLRDPVARLASHIPASSELVQVAATYPFTTPSVLRRAHRMNIPTVLDFHFEPYLDSPWGRAAIGLYNSWGPRSYRLAHAILLRSRSYAENARSLRTTKDERWRVLPNGVDPLRYHPPDDPADRDYLLFVGRLVPYKGLHTLIRALAADRLPIPLYIAGNGPLRGRLESFARSLDVDVRFLGRVPDERLPALYQHAAATVLPSVNHQEAFGITLVESMACGTPVVASDLPGVRDVAARGGLLAPPGDPVQLAKQLHNAVAPGLLERGPVLAKKIHQWYSWENVTDRLLEVYHEVLTAAPDREKGGTDHPHPVGDPVL